MRISASTELPFRSQVRRRVRKLGHSSIAERAVGGALRFIYQATPLSLYLHINAATSGVDIEALLRGGNADYHTGLICHDGAGFATAKSHAARARATDIIMTVEILKML